MINNWNSEQDSQYNPASCFANAACKSGKASLALGGWFALVSASTYWPRCVNMLRQDHRLLRRIFWGWKQPRFFPHLSNRALRTTHIPSCHTEPPWRRDGRQLCTALSWYLRKKEANKQLPCLPVFPPPSISSSISTSCNPPPYLGPHSGTQCFPQNMWFLLARRTHTLAHTNTWNYQWRIPILRLWHTGRLSELVNWTGQRKASTVCSLEYVAWKASWHIFLTHVDTNILQRHMTTGLHEFSLFANSFKQEKTAKMQINLH